MLKLNYIKLFTLILLFTNTIKLTVIYAGNGCSIQAIKAYASRPKTLQSLLATNINIPTLKKAQRIELASQIPTTYDCLHFAAIRNNLANLEWLLQNGANMHINKAVNFSQYYEYYAVTPLHFATTPEIVRRLLDAGADITKCCGQFTLPMYSGTICDYKYNITPLKTLYFLRDTESYGRLSWKTPEGRIALDESIAILEDAELKARMSPERAAWLSAVYQATELLD